MSFSEDIINSSKTFEHELRVKHLKVSKKIFEHISSLWNFKLDESVPLLGFKSVDEYEGFYKLLNALDDKEVCVEKHQLEVASKVSYLMSIVRIIYEIGSANDGAELIRRELPRFGHRVPLKVFLDDGLAGMDEFREFLYSI